MDNFHEVLSAEGRLRRFAKASGPVPPAGTEVVLQTSDDEDEAIRLESVLRSLEGTYVRITIEQLPVTGAQSDAELQRPSTVRDTLNSPRG